MPEQKDTIEFLRMKENNLVELLEQVEMGISLGQENLEYLLDNDPDLDRIQSARKCMDVSKEEFAMYSKELEDVRKKISEI